MDLKKFLKSDLAKNPHYLLIGNPVSHSVSPLMHNTALNHHDLSGNYIAVSVEPYDLDLLATHFNREEFLGANVTIPHKEHIIEYVDELTDTAKAIAAVNTIIKINGRIVGDNTDVYGFIHPLEELEDLELDRAIIFGTGGATKAIIYALNDFGFNEVCTVTRKPKAQAAQSDVIICSYDDWQHYSDEATLFVNATPLGMAPNFDSSPIKDSEIELLAGKVCYDIVYNPRETKLLKQTKHVDGIPIGGLDMLVHQGDESFYLWTGKRFPLGLVKLKLDEHFTT